tara:strand:- start:910 stop:1176 length:267 start_codon:yes stop_codon:yes gene_type:complete
MVLAAEGSVATARYADHGRTPVTATVVKAANDVINGMDEEEWYGGLLPGHIEAGPGDLIYATGKEPGPPKNFSALCLVERAVDEAAGR